MPVTKIKLSESTDGRRILLGTAPTTVHIAAASDDDSIWLNFHNSVDNATERVTIQWGGVTAIQDFIKFDVPPEGGGLWWAVKGDLLTGGVLLRCFSETNNVVTAGGWVLRDTGET